MSHTYSKFFISNTLALFCLGVYDPMHNHSIGIGNKGLYDGQERVLIALCIVGKQPYFLQLVVLNMKTRKQRLHDTRRRNKILLCFIAHNVTKKMCTAPRPVHAFFPYIHQISFLPNLVVDRDKTKRTQTIPSYQKKSLFSRDRKGSTFIL